IARMALLDARSSAVVVRLAGPNDFDHSARLENKCVSSPDHSCQPRSCSAVIRRVLPSVFTFPCADPLVAFALSKQLTSLPFHLLSLSPVTPSFEGFASPDQPFAAFFLSFTNTKLAIWPCVITI